jgi:hypothetical protein
VLVLHFDHGELVELEIGRFISEGTPLAKI